jgi:hypothetical protein
MKGKMVSPNSRQSILERLQDASPALKALTLDQMSLWIGYQAMV